MEPFTLGISCVDRKMIKDLVELMSEGWLLIRHGHCDPSQLGPTADVDSDVEMVRRGVVGCRTNLESARQRARAMPLPQASPWRFPGIVFAGSVADVRSLCIARIALRRRIEVAAVIPLLDEILAELEMDWPKESLSIQIVPKVGRSGGMFLDTGLGRDQRPHDELHALWFQAHLLRYDPAHPSTVTHDVRDDGLLDTLCKISAIMTSTTHMPFPRRLESVQAVDVLVGEYFSVCSTSAETFEANVPDPRGLRARGLHRWNASGDLRTTLKELQRILARVREREPDAKGFAQAGPCRPVCIGLLKELLGSRLRVVFMDAGRVRQDATSEADLNELRRLSDLSFRAPRTGS